MLINGLARTTRRPAQGQPRGSTLRHQDNQELWLAEVSAAQQAACRPAVRKGFGLSGRPSEPLFSGYPCSLGGVRSLVLELALRWLWADLKLLISSDFLALVLALAVIDSKGLLGFGSDARCN
jgi:hypothetical protein